MTRHILSALVATTLVTGTAGSMSANQATAHATHQGHERHQGGGRINEHDVASRSWYARPRGHVRRAAANGGTTDRGARGDSQISRRDRVSRTG
jgi:hypothetical protein